MIERASLRLIDFHAGRGERVGRIREFNKHARAQGWFCIILPRQTRAAGQRKLRSYLFCIICARESSLALCVREVRWKKWNCSLTRFSKVIIDISIACNWLFIRFVRVYSFRFNINSLLWKWHDSCWRFRFEGLNAIKLDLNVKRILYRLICWIDFKYFQYFCDQLFIARNICNFM